MNNTDSRPPVDLVKQILKSPEAQRMRWMVTSGFYDRSRIGLWMYEVMGREYDDMAQWARSLRYEAFPQTCTWSVGIWEWVYGIEPDDALPLDFRRGRILSKKLQRPPINPARIEAILSALTGVPIIIIEDIAPYTFEVKLDETNLSAINKSLMFKLLREIKPSHLSAVFNSLVYTLFVNTEAFNFTDFSVKSTFKERTAIRGFRLNGEKMLDSAWLLDSYYPGLPFVDFCAKSKLLNIIGTTAQQLNMSPFTIKNLFDISTSAQYFMRVGNQHDLRHIGISINVLLRNHGMQMQGITLEGWHNLDGIWPLYSELREIFRGMAEHQLEIGAYTARNPFNVELSAQYPMTVDNQESFIQYKVKVAGLKASQPYDLAGVIEKDSRWALDGNSTLNGSRSLNQYHIKEDL